MTRTVISPTAIRQLTAIYCSLPRLDCKHLCFDSCGPVAATTIEEARILAKTGRSLEKDTYLMASRTKSADHLVCPFLKDGLCTIYTVRPLICRLWGCVEKLRCHHGCTPDRWLSDDEARNLFKRIRGLMWQ